MAPASWMSSKGPVFSLTPCCRHLEILNSFWMRDLAFSLWTGPCKLSILADPEAIYALTGMMEPWVILETSVDSKAQKAAGWDCALQCGHFPTLLGNKWLNPLCPEFQSHPSSPCTLVTSDTILTMSVVGKGKEAHSENRPEPKCLCCQHQ